jgi:hypothetical protein
LEKIKTDDKKVSYCVTLICEPLEKGEGVEFVIKVKK